MSKSGAFVVRVNTQLSAIIFKIANASPHAIDARSLKKHLVKSQNSYAPWFDVATAISFVYRPSLGRLE